MSHSDRQSRIKQILDEAADLSSAEREKYLQNICSEDGTLRDEVDSLLRHLDLPTDTADKTHQYSSSDSPLIEIPPPDSIGPYKIIDKIGEGGMGVVYKATQSLPRRTVALKVIKPQSVTRHSLERFNFETQVLGRLQHPGIAQIYDAGTTKTEFGEQPYFAMEFVRGTPLAEYIKLRHCTLPERLTLIQKIADAVHHAHTRGVVHRDIKPANILVTDDGEPKILDFGVARSVGSGIDGSASMTRVGQLVGTVPYMSPEQVSGDSDEIDARSDIYSLGVVLYELLAGHLPYNLEKRLIHEAVRVIREVEPEHLSSISRVYKGDIETIVSKALSKERSRRYQSASEFASDIHRYLNNQPVMARPASAWYQISKLAKRHRMIAAGVAIASVGIIVGFGIAVWQLDRAVQAENALQTANVDLSNSLVETQSQRDRAETVLDKLSILTASLGEFEHSIRRLEGATSARRVLATSATEVLTELSQAGEAYPWIREDLADSSISMGEIAMASSETLDLAEQAFKQAKALFVALAQDSPDIPRFIAGQIRADIGMSSVQHRAGATQAAAALSADAELNARKLASENPDSSEWSILHARTLLQRGGILRQQARLNEALVHYEKTQSLLEHISAGDVNRDDLFIRAMRGQAILLDELGQSDQADMFFTQSILASRAFVGTHTRDAVGKLRLIELLYFSAERLETLGRDADALTLHIERLGFATSLSKADPDNEAAHVAVVTAHDAIAHAQLELGEIQLAELSGKAFLAAARLHADADPTDLIKHRRVALAEELLGDISREPILSAARTLARENNPDKDELSVLLARFADSLSHYDETLATLEWLSSMDEQSAQFKRDSARVQVKRANTFELMGRLDVTSDSSENAEKAYLMAIEQYEALDTLGDLKDSERALWARSLRNLATASLNMGNGKLAAEQFELADEILPRRRADVIARKAAAYHLAGDQDKAQPLAQTVLDMLIQSPKTPNAGWLTEQMNLILSSD